jgi:galactose oxidase-like protein
VHLPFSGKIPSESDSDAAHAADFGAALFRDRDFRLICDCQKLPEEYDVRMNRKIPRGDCRPVFAFSWPASFAFLLLFVGAGFVPGQLRAGSSGFFEPTGSRNAPAFGDAATLLPSGRVLAAGELYDPVSGTWAVTASGGSSWPTLLPNGKVLTEGGFFFNGHFNEGRPYASLYNPVTGNWEFTAEMTGARYGHTATLLPNGLALVIGGLNVFALTGAEVFDPASETWSPTGQLITARAHHSATLLPNGKVLIAGGDNGYGNGVLASSELYDPASGISTSTGSLGVARFNHRAILLPNGRVLVVGGENDATGTHPLASAELYDPASGTWSATGSLGSARRGSTATLLPDGKVLVTGGSDGASTILSSAELYDPAIGAWLPTGSLLTGRSSHSATLLANGKVLIAGGYDGSNTLSSAELYVGPSTPPALLNIATRLRVLTGDQVLIGGFIITGPDLKRVLIRGIGPSLNGVGVTLPDPTLELHQGETTIASNDNWKLRPNLSSQQEEIEATTIPPLNDSESAILRTLSPGAYTVTLAGKSGGTGVGLVEIYDLGPGANSHLANISTRGFVDAGDNVMIGGLIVGGGSGGTTRVMARALGPSMSVSGALIDPTLELHDGSGTLIASNDNWKTRPDGSSQQAEIEATTIPPTNDLESALVRTLPPGNYTAIVQGNNHTTGIGLLETYNLP